MRKEPFLQRIPLPEPPEGKPSEDEGTVVQPISIGPESEGPLSKGPNSEGPISEGLPSLRSTSSGFRPLPRAAEPVQVGDVLKERFVLEQVLGAGGMGKVFLALDLRKQEASDRNPYVAIKVLKESLREHPSSIIALQREARKAQELSHPNIIKVYDFDRDGDRFFITMEYLTGKSLDRIIRAEGFTSMPPTEAGRIINAVGEALAFAHGNGFVHWDLKPGNIFITDTGRVKVIDFGLARAIKQPTAGDEDATAFDVGSLGAMTPAYASPEMIETQTPDPRGDIYSLACITYELLAGHHPFGRMPATHARDTRMKLARIRGLGKAQMRALQNALEFDAARRTPSVEVFLRDMRLGRGSAAPKFGLAAKVGLAGTAAAALTVGGLWWTGWLAPDLPASAPEKSAARPAETAADMAPRTPKAAPPPTSTATPTPTPPPTLPPTSTPTSTTTQTARLAPPPPVDAKPPAKPPEPERPKALDVPRPPQPDPPVPKPAVLTVPPRPVEPRPIEPPGVEDVRALMGGWCSEVMKLTLAPAEWTLSLPSGSNVPMRVSRYESADGMLLVELTGADGRRTFWEFGEFSGNNGTMVQLRARSDGDPDWREYNRPFRRC
ncbi:serine/threonine-protein kinase [Azospirillum rugosum]|uniref:Serine/threonine protein kinase n=1 Tax=Azospirillum rugosum TaxID=416170 RepID=A0ABS4SKW1_9PROT|nr:serine/threonine-protein kinase [Azospirillum rugosum]MBP2293206.1 serine/threonine protein kinase [Azospirillum rugosum]